jgi:hypothetical protein
LRFGTRFHWGSIFIAEPKVEPHSNLIGKFEPESNLIVVELELEPEPCDLGYGNSDVFPLANCASFRLALIPC